MNFSNKVNGHPTGGLQHRTHHLTHSQPGNLHKLLVNGNGVSSSTSSANISTISIPTIAQHGTNGNRLAPGGAELNLLPPNSTPNGAIFRNQGKMIVKGETEFIFVKTKMFIFFEIFHTENNANRVHVMQSTPTIVVSQPQSINIITSSPQLAGKVNKITEASVVNFITNSSNFPSQMLQSNAPQYLSKSMIVVNHNGNGSPTSTSNDFGKNHN